jgi:membrane-associated phospholipid phosphatase
MVQNWNSQNKLISILLLVIFAIWGVLAAVFGIYDLGISQLFVNQNSVWGIIGADYGEIPGFCLLLIAIGILIGSLFNNKHKQKIPSYIIIIICLGFLIYALVIGEYDGIQYPIGMIISLIGFVSIFYVKDFREFRRISWVILLLGLFNPLFFVQMMKLLTHRIRYRNLLDIGFENYTSWFSSFGPNTEHNSFPSGHTAMGWMLLPLIIPVLKMKWKHPLKIITLIIVFFVGIFVGLSRIKVGAHFASDVLFSTGAAFVYTILLYQWFYNTKIKRKEYLKIINE